MAIMFYTPEQKEDILLRPPAGLPWDLAQKGDKTRAYNLRTLPGINLMKPGEGYWLHPFEDCEWIVG